MIIVDSRQRDPKSELIVKYTNKFGTPIEWKPIRKINPDASKLSKLAKWILEKLSDKYIGGFLINKTSVMVEGYPGSLYDITVKQKGQTETDRIFKCYGKDKNTRASCYFLFDVFEPNNDETNYLNQQADKILQLSGPNGRIIINKEIFNN